MRAIQKLQLLSPLRECGLTKSQVGRLSKEAGLFTWDKPAYACLATRIPVGEEITGNKLSATEHAEAFLVSLGFTDFRVRDGSVSIDNALLKLKTKPFDDIGNAKIDMRRRSPLRHNPADAGF